MEKLWYRKPAKHWREALPIGNGLTGVMVYGGKKVETLAFNDGTLWSGYPKDQTNANSLKHLKEVQELIFAGKNSEADKLTMKQLTGAYSESFLPLGQLVMRFRGLSSVGYKRELSLSKAVHTVSTEGVTRETFASYPDKVVVYHVKSKSPFSVALSAKSELHNEIILDGALNLVGNAPDYVAPNYLFSERKPVRYDCGKGMCFCLRTEVDTDGVVSSGRRCLNIKDATELTLYMTTATGFQGYDKMPITQRPVALAQCKELLSKVERSYDALRKRHIADYRAIYDKHKLSLGEDVYVSTYDLMRMAKKGNVKPALSELFYNYGKYMTIAGSRSGGQALNLQGIWNNSMRPPWSSNYTTNINAEMNYWGATTSNLSDCIEPYINLVYEIMQAGKKTAKVNYGCSGFACNHNVDIWRKTAPVQGSASYMYAPMCGVWLTNELYSHYKNGELTQYQDKIFELVREATAFVNDYLVLHDGYYVTCPSASPEADFKHGGNTCRLDYASAFEMGLAKQLFANFIESSDDDSKIEEVSQKLAKLYPFKHGETGLMEWHKDFPMVEKGHRHFSPLYGFYPANVIGYYHNPQETEWVKELFEYRTANSNQYIGWSAAWAICLAGRLHDGRKASEVINSMLAHSVFYNLFGVHPPSLFQIDGNLGFVAGVNALLLYCEDSIVDLLPALPENWKNGFASGVVINGAQLSFRWKHGKVTEVFADRPVCLRNLNLSETVETNEFISILGGDM